MDELNKEQRQAADAVIAGKSLFITGPGGVGKSFLLQVLHEHFERDIKNMAITAMTGCAALLIGPYAKTLHSWAGIGLGRGNPETIIEAIQKDSKKKKRWRQTDVLVIDEVSMLTPALLELLDVVGRRIRKVDRPFGGLQMVYVGDFYQLPPVSKDGPASFAFTSPLWPERRVELTQIIRQKDPAFQKILNEARRGELSAESYAALEARKTMDWKRQEIKPTLLFTKNMDVNAINENKLAKLPGEEHAFKATTTAPARMPAQAVQWAVEKLDRDASYEPVLRLKLGAQVMLLKNVCREDMDEKGKISKTPIQGLVNGSRGVITGFAPDGNPLVKFLSGPPYPVRIVPAAWESDADETEKVTREQIPLRLAYALTIHKAQGASLDSALIDVGPSTFEYGQAYVALSRARSLEALFIYEISAKAFKAHPAVVEFYARPPGIVEEAGAECDVAAAAEAVTELATDADDSDLLKNHGKVWSEKEVKELLAGIADKKTYAELAEIHRRTRGSVKSKLEQIAVAYYLKDNKSAEEISVLTGLNEDTITTAVAFHKVRLAVAEKKKAEKALVEKPKKGRKSQKSIVEFLPSSADEVPPSTP